MIEIYQKKNAVRPHDIGNLKEESGGTPIVGEDVVRILRKGKQ